MQFSPDLRDRVADGTITVSYRLWSRPQVKVGGVYRSGPVLIEIDDIELLPFSSITGEDLARTGEPDLETLRRRAAHAGPIHDATVLYRVEFHVVRQRTTKAADPDRRLGTANDVRLDRWRGLLGDGLVLFDVLVRQLAWRARQPAVDDDFSECSPRHRLQLDEDGWVIVEVRNREEGFRIGGEDGLLLGEVLYSDSQDWCGRRSGIAESSDVCLAEWPLPRERLPSDGPCAVAMTLSLGNLGQLQGHPSHFVDAHHFRTVALRHASAAETPRQMICRPGQ